MGLIFFLLPRLLAVPGVNLPPAALISTTFLPFPSVCPSVRSRARSDKVGRTGITPAEADQRNGEAKKRSYFCYPDRASRSGNT